MANLRVLYNNVATTSTISSSSSAINLPPTNLLKESKGVVWRSIGTTATIDLVWVSAQVISCVLIPFNNLTSTATIRVRLYTGIGGITGPVYDTTNIPAITSYFETWSDTPTGVNTYGFGKGGYTALWLPYTTSVTKISISIIDTNNPDGYLEASTILTGDYWSPVRNTSFGIELGVSDLSDNIRTQSGNLITNSSPSYRTLKFTLDYMPAEDRNKLLQILRINGKRNPLFISLFPEDIDKEKESMYQIYGKLSNLNSITHPIFTMYTSSIDIEEV